MSPSVGERRGENVGGQTRSQEDETGKVLQCTPEPQTEQSESYSATSKSIRDQTGTSHFYVPRLFTPRAYVGLSL